MSLDARLLGVVALMASFAVPGCVDDQPLTEGGGTSGAAGFGGGSGASGDGGTSGIGGAGAVDPNEYDDYDGCTKALKLSCSQTCGIDNRFLDDVPSTIAGLECSVMGVPIALAADLAARVADDSTPEAPQIDITTKLLIPTPTVDLILNLTCDITVVRAKTTIASPQNAGLATTALTPVPCLVCFDRGVEVIINMDPVVAALDVPAAEIELTLTEVEFVLNAAGLELLLSTAGEAPTCEWVEGDRPTVRLNTGDDDDVGRWFESDRWL